MSTKNFIEIPCIEIEQPIGTFYIGAINYDDLINISIVESRHLDPDLDDYLGVQRELSKKRVEELQQYVNAIDATFPTGIILAIMSEDWRWCINQKVDAIRLSGVKSYATL